MQETKTDIFRQWLSAYLILCFVAATTTAMYAKFGGWMLAILLFMWLILFCLYGNILRLRTEQMLLDSKYSGAINLLAESIKLNSNHLYRIDDWIRSNSFPKTTTKLH